ncbi:CLUMA_CG013546, isoform A [Clunio marinus]|uniref:CLUMA_CG013546, isoform A n=1 Tax=Clunio marinus TaxID=568069 RepID=A0A1J1IP55_9DIPT|nr:CLUMA_CG013546, isoform A [Clunio marinus]
MFVMSSLNFKAEEKLKYLMDNSNDSKAIKDHSSLCDSSTHTNSSENYSQQCKNNDDDFESESSTVYDSDTEQLEIDSVPKVCQVYDDEKNISQFGNVIIIDQKEENNKTSPKFESVSIHNSSDIQIGNKTFYNGPVTIKQFLVDDKNNKWVENQNFDNKSELSLEGIINKGYVVSQNNVIESPLTKDKHNKCGNEILKLRESGLYRKNVYLILLTAICSMIGIILLRFYVMKGEDLKHGIVLGDGDDSRKNIAINSTIGSDLLLGNVLRMISRDEWLAQPANNELSNLILPAKRVIIAHTATEPCDTQASCTLRTRYIQTFHMESRSWDDIAYNFLIGGDGAVYEGRGWDKQGAHTKGYNVGSIGVAYIGTFTKKLPNEKQIHAGFLLFKEGVRLKKLLPDYKIYAHRQLIPSESPGAAFYEIIKKWDHWASDAPEIL